MDVAVRYAAGKDVDTIYKFGIKTSEFSVSKEIRFYEKREILEWLRDKENIFIIAADGSRIIALLYCKIMSYHWAMVDNFYVLPKFRKHGIGSRMEEFLEKELKKRKIVYLTRLIRPENKASRNFLKERGFLEHHKYIWIDKFL